MIILDGNRMGERGALHAHLKEKLSLPDYYGGNLDALNDCLGERRERELIVIERAGEFLEGCGDYGLRLLSLFGEHGLQVPVQRLPVLHLVAVQYNHGSSSGYICVKVL